MSDVEAEAKRAVSLALVASMIVQPFESALTREELKTVVVASGITPGLFDEVADHEARERSPHRHTDTFDFEGSDLMLLRHAGSQSGYPRQVPVSAFYEVGKAFLTLNRDGVQKPKTLEMLQSQCSASADHVRCALAMLVAYNVVQPKDGGFVCRNFQGDYGQILSNHPAEAKLDKMLDLVRSVVAARSGSTAPTTPPTQRFHLFLKKQGWEGLAGWWAHTHQEFAALSDRYPVAATVLAGSLLEAALTAIAQPAQQAGEWKRPFLNDDPRTWQLKQLIGQAEAAKTFSEDDVSLANTLAELRNRIHVGKLNRSGFPRGSKSWENGSHGKEEQVLARGSRASCWAREGNAAESRFGVGGHHVGGRKDRVHGGGAAQVGAASPA